MKDYQDIFFNKNSSSQIYKSSITCSVGVYMMNPKFLSRKLIKLYNELVENFYMEPPGEDRVSSFIETPVAFIDINITSTSKDKGRRNDSKGKIRKSESKERMLSRRTLEASLEAQLL